jgi:cytochrome c oxidase cbb3-type subunit 3
MKINKKFFYIVSTLFIFSFHSQLFAAGEDSLDKVMRMMLIVTLVIIGIVLWLAVIYSEQNDNEGKAFKAPLIKLRLWLTKSTPVEREQEILLSHEYDGIRELDNKIPPWFSALFYGTIIWGVIYLMVFHVFDDGRVQEKEYLAEVQQANMERQILIKSGVFINEETVTASDDPIILNEGKEIYIKNCLACHGQDGGGLVGPNLTDEFWIHGGGIKNIFKVIKYGVPQKGMISWQTQLDPNKMRAVGSYILTFQGSKPANGKEPEGEKWIEPE